MEQSTARRRLVKSPPELWAQISDPAALARRLAQFGAIRITRRNPETTVAWEGDRESGTVELAAAGLGTTVTLTVNARASPSGEATPDGTGAILDDVLDDLGATSPRSRARD
jgi:hypothetical protein